jgi:AcrR family transcriptional regulator
MLFSFRMQSTPSSRRDPAELPGHQQQRRQRIVAAALELLEHGDFDRVQVRDVAERAGVALGTVYRYFSSKEHLYAAALVEWATTRAGVPRPPASGPPAERLRQALRRSSVALRDWPQIVRTEMQLEASADTNAQELVEVVWVLYRATLQGVLFDLPPERAADIVRVCSAELYRSMRMWALGRCTHDDVTRQLDGTVDLIFGPPPT